MLNFWPFKKKPTTDLACCVLSATNATTVSNDHLYNSTLCEVAERIHEEALLGNKITSAIYLVAVGTHPVVGMSEALGKVKLRLEKLGYTVTLHISTGNATMAVAWL